MEFFGYGVSNPINVLIRPGYKEPESPPDMKEIILKGNYKGSFNELIREVDVYNGILDGYAYRSYQKLISTRQKGFHKPEGPGDMYTDTINSSMNYGWYFGDPDLEGKTFYKDDCNWHNRHSEETRYYNAAVLKEKNFRL